MVVKLARRIVADSRNALPCARRAIRRPIHPAQGRRHGDARADRPQHLLPLQGRRGLLQPPAGGERSATPSGATSRPTPRSRRSRTTSPSIRTASTPSSHAGRLIGFAVIAAQSGKVARPAGFEPATLPLRRRMLYPLSYGRPERAAKQPTGLRQPVCCSVPGGTGNRKAASNRPHTVKQFLASGPALLRPCTCIFSTSGKNQPAAPAPMRGRPSFRPQPAHTRYAPRQR